MGSLPDKMALIITLVESYVRVLMEMKAPMLKSVCPPVITLIIVLSSVYLRLKQVSPFALYLTKYPHPVALLSPKTTAGKFEVNLVKKIEFKVN